MKHKYFISSTIISAVVSVSFSQITITKADLLSGSDTIRMSTASVIGIPDPKLTGTNYTWDYSTLNPTLQYMDTFVAVTSTPFIYQLYFNNSVLYPKYKASFGQKAPDFTAIPQIQLTNTYNYIKNSTTGFSIVGFGSTFNGIPLPVKYDSVDVVYKFPMNYGNKDSSISKYVVSIPGIGYYGQRKKRVNEVEGWGTVITPYGTFSALKVKSTLHITDTIYYSALSYGVSLPLPVQYEYKWLTTGKKIPVLEIDANTFAATSVVYRDSLRAGVVHVGINEMSNENNFLVYPNPANENINLNYTIVQTGAVRLEIIDVYGRSVKIVVDERKLTGKYSHIVNVNDLNIAKGIYFIQFVVNGRSTVQKLIVQ